MEKLSDTTKRQETLRKLAVDRFTTKDEYGMLLGKIDLAHASTGAIVKVDSFISTINTDDWQILYGPPERMQGDLEMDQEPVTTPTLIRLKERYSLYEKLGKQGLDVERLIPIRTWLKGLWKHGSPIDLPYWDTEYLLHRAEKMNEEYYCVHYSVALLQCVRSLGFSARLINLHRSVIQDCEPGKEFINNPPCCEHVVIEVWSQDLEKWVVFDTDYDCNFMEDSQYLNSKDIHDRILSGHDKSISMIYGQYTDVMMGKRKLSDRLLYYTHVSIFLRNNFLSDSINPVRIAHYIDEFTKPILWWFGEDMVPRPDLMGPIHVAKPYTDYTRVLNDGRLDTCWASSDLYGEHWAKVEWPKEVIASHVVIHWADRGIPFRTSQRYTVEIFTKNGWLVVAEVNQNCERAWNHHVFEPTSISSLKVCQFCGGGHEEFPNRLWLRQIQVF